MNDGIDVVSGASALDARAGEWDALVAVTETVDPFCTSSVWSFAAAASLTVAGDPVLAVGHGAMAGFRPHRGDGVELLLGLDPIWGFATPVVGRGRDVGPTLRAAMRMPHDLAVITGQDRASPLTHAIADALDGTHSLHVGPSEARLRVDLSDGADAWFGRRSSRFRQRIRGVVREADRAGIAVHPVTDEADWFDRLLAVEATSWKGREDSGLRSPDLAAFYRDIARRLVGRGTMHAWVATLDDRDVGYLLGGQVGPVYRGFQLSYDDDHRDLSIGHVLQWHQIQALEGSGVELYDMGMDMPYKRRWADRIDETFALVARRR